MLRTYTAANTDALALAEYRRLAHPGDDLIDEPARTALGVRGALAHPRVQHLAGVGPCRQQRVVTQHLRVAERRACLAPPDTSQIVESTSTTRRARSRPRTHRPRPPQRLATTATSNTAIVAAQGALSADTRDNSPTIDRWIKAFSPRVQNAGMSEQNLVIRRGRHFGWWIQGRAGRGFMMFDWWPTKRLALMVARFWVRAAKRAGAGEVTIEVRDTGD